MKTSGIGGQAVIEGVMMRYKNDIAVAVRKPNGEIEVGKQTTTSPKDKCKIFGWPIIRGVVAFVYSLVIGIKTLTFSANFFAEDENEPPKEKTEKKKTSESDNEQIFEKEENAISAGVMFGTVAFSLVFAIALFMVAPYYASVGIMKLFNTDSTVVLAIVEGVIKLLIFIGYVAVISLMKDIKRTFMYHGSEHKCINCIESGHELTVDNVMVASKEHRRCGTSFIFFVLFISIIIFIFLRFDTRWLRFVVRILLIPVIAGLSYEFIQWAGNSDSKLAAILSRPGMWVQALTTKEPDRKMVEVAIASVEAVFDWRDYLRSQGVEVADPVKPEETEEVEEAEPEIAEESE